MFALSESLKISNIWGVGGLVAGLVSEQRFPYSAESSKKEESVGELMGTGSRTNKMALVQSR